uniref:Proline-rich transmembrane protein 4 n=1 Tax=Sphaeramia orbicularis TaxID=375764 RepID=A0A673AH18_9TELE
LSIANAAPEIGHSPFINSMALFLKILTRNFFVPSDESKDNDWQVSNTSASLSLGGNLDTAPTPCKTSNQSWMPTDPDDFSSTESVYPSAALSFALFVPLYSDWNSALATWGLAWEAHIYGLGSVFSVFGLISVVCLFGLPLRCPPGSLFFTLLHLFLLAFAGTQAFCLLYDAYSYQDRLPPLASLLLSALPFPCLIAAFSLAFLLISLRSRMHISLPLAISASFSTLPKPFSLACAGILQLFPSLPTMILLLPQGVFVCLTIFLSCSYLIFYCLMRVDNKHIYRLNDNGESGGSPEVVRPPSCPFAKVEDWGRAARAGVGASLCLLASGGLQLYGILHTLGLGGVDGLGFQPWPWWGFQVGCRLSEIGVCLGLSLIGTHPIFCHSNSSIKTIIQPRPGSWSRLSCSSPSRGLTLPSQGDVGSSGKSDTLPLCSMVDSPGNGLDCVPKSSHTRTPVLPLPIPPTPPQRLKNIAESHLSSVDNLGLADSTVDLRPPSPIDLSRSIDQALFSESLFSHSIFGWPRLFHGSSSLSLSSPEQSDWKGSVSGSTQGLCSKARETGKLRSHSWANRGQNFTHSSLPRAIPHLSYYRRYRTLSLASQDSQGSGRLAGTKHLSESKQLEWDLAVQAEFVNVCRQIDALSVCSDTIEL